MLLASDDQNLEEIYKEVRIPLSALALDINIYPTLHSDPLYTRSLLVKDHPLARVENLKSQLIGSSSKLLFHRSANIETFFNSYSLQYFFYLKLADIL